MNRNPPKSFHATNPFGNIVRDATSWETLTNSSPEPTITDMFLEFMSDYIPSTDQNTEMTTAAEQLGSSQAPLTVLIQWIVQEILREITRGPL